MTDGITFGYVKGYQDCLDEFSSAINDAIKHTRAPKTLNTLITTLHLQKIKLADLYVSLEDYMNSSPDLFDDDECLCEECKDELCKGDYEEEFSPMLVLVIGGKSKEDE